MTKKPPITCGALGVAMLLAVCGCDGSGGGAADARVGGADVQGGGAEGLPQTDVGGSGRNVASGTDTAAARDVAAPRDATVDTPPLRDMGGGDDLGGSGQDGGGQDGGGQDGVAPPPPADALYASGSRLRAWVWRSAGDTRSLDRFHDRELERDCEPEVAPDGEIRCLPDPVPTMGLVYRAPDCTGPAQVIGYLPDADHRYEYEREGVSTCDRAPLVTIYEVTEATAQGPLYEAGTDAQGNPTCSPYTVPSGGGGARSGRDRSAVHVRAVRGVDRDGRPGLRPDDPRRRRRLPRGDGVHPRPARRVYGESAPRRAPTATAGTADTARAVRVATGARVRQGATGAAATDVSAPGPTGRGPSPPSACSRRRRPLPGRGAIRARPSRRTRRPAR